MLAKIVVSSYVSSGGIRIWWYECIAEGGGGRYRKIFVASSRSIQAEHLVVIRSLRLTADHARDDRTLDGHTDHGEQPEEEAIASFSYVQPFHFENVNFRVVSGALNVLRGPAMYGVRCRRTCVCACVCKSQ